MRSQHLRTAADDGTVLNDLAAHINAVAAPHDEDGSFPRAAIAYLAERRLLALPSADGAADAAPFSVMHRLLRLLAAVGRGDLSVGRILEGHFNALQLIDLFAKPAMRESWLREAAQGALFGVWNTDHPGFPVTLATGPGGDVLGGAKSFASAVDGVDCALITAATEAGRQMLVVPVRADANVDRSWWRPLGMRATGSHVISFDGMEVDPVWRLGGADDYVKAPWFVAGAIRFAAVHVGGLHAVFDIVRDHLVGLGRADDPYQRHRLAEIASAVEGGYGWLRGAADAWDRGCIAGASAEEGRRAEAYANLTRTAVERLAMEAATTAQRAVGCAGLIAPHRLERVLRDLLTYLRQPNPDGALAAAGAAVAGGTLSPGEH